MGRRRRRESEQHASQDDQTAAEGSADAPQGNHDEHRHETSPSFATTPGTEQHTGHDAADTGSQDDRQSAAAASPPPVAPQTQSFQENFDNEAGRERSQREVGSEDPTISRFERKLEAANVDSEDPTISRHDAGEETAANHSEDPTIKRNP